MNIVIPMAGLGDRFKKAGFSLPKPLIPIENKPMYRYVVDGLPLDYASNIVFILRESLFSNQIEQDIHANYSHLAHYNIITLPHETQGQAETILLASAVLDKNQPTLVHNCDTYVKDKLNWSEIIQEEIDGAVVLFESREPRWSYARLNGANTLITEFREKQVISTHASTGTYYFKDTEALLTRIQYAIKNNLRENNEFYLSTIYQLMLENKKLIKPLWSELMLCFGTPEDLVFSLNRLLTGKVYHDTSK